MTATVSVPTFEWSGFYYGELLEDVIQYFRDQGLSLDESPEEPFMQLASVICASTHLNNVLLDITANEMFLPTARLRDSVVALLALIDYQLAQTSPADAVLVHRLSQAFTSTVNLIPKGAVFATRATATEPPIEYEVSELFSTLRTDQLVACFAYDGVLLAYTDETANANGAGPWSPTWGAGATPGDILYFGHTSIGWNKVRNTIIGSATGIVGVWEFYDGDWDDGKPDNVTNIGTGLRLELNGLMGTASRTGTTIRVRCNQTGAYQDIASAYVGGVNRVDTVGFLGQTVPSLDLRDYTVGRDWDEMDDSVDASVSFTAAPGLRDVDYTVPKSATKWWTKTEINGITAYWIRFRIISVFAPVAPTLTKILIQYGKQYAFTDVVQGRSREDAPLASSTGLPDQECTLARFPVLDSGIMVYVTEGAIEEVWTRVATFLTSNGSDKHYRVTFDSDGRATIAFGDGVNGKVPAAGIDNIRATYRTMEDQDGNVGSNTIVVNRSGVAYIADVSNPRVAEGYAPKEGSTPQGLERAKILGPASLRNFGKATSVPDVVDLVESYKTTDGSDLFSRALAIEGGFGPKTVEVVLVKNGGLLATSDELDDLETYFNGDTARKIRGIIVMNQQVVAVNYTPRVINVVATVYGGNLTSAVAAVTALLNPEAKLKNSDGTESTEWEWEFGELIPVSKIVTAIMESDPRPRNVIVVTPATDTILTAQELPIIGTVTITLVP